MKEKSVWIFLAISAFFILTVCVAKQATRPMDYAITQFIQQFGNRQIDYGMYFFTIIGSLEFSCFAILVICWYFYYRYNWPGVFLYLFFFMALSGVEFIWKYFVTYTGPGPEFDRNPPLQWISLISVRTPFSFPSGHTFRSVFLFGIWYQRLGHKLLPLSSKILFQKIIIVLFIIAIGISRIYLGDHWFSDVAGGCLLALIGLLLASQSPHYEFNTA